MKQDSYTVKDGKVILSKLILGSSDYLKLDNMEKVDKMFTLYVSKGGRTFDTARHYRESESVIGKWLSDKKREDYTIITKACHPIRGKLDVPRVNPEAILADIETSLEMLQTDYVDVLLLHRDDPTQPVGPLMETLSKLVDDKVIRAFGVSNWELPRVIEAKKYCENNNLNPLSFNSPNFSLAKVNEPRWENCVTADETMLAWHEENNFPLISWSAQAEAFFGNRFTPEDVNDPAKKEFVQVYFNETNWKRLSVCEKLGKEKGVKPIQISLAYVLNQAFPSYATIGPEEEWQLLESVEAMNLPLSPAEIEQLKMGGN
ncbi:aldo/keto reductase [Lapidilactobacillus salsurivasis]